MSHNFSTSMHEQKLKNKQNTWFTDYRKKVSSIRSSGPSIKHCLELSGIIILLRVSITILNLHIRVESHARPPPPRPKPQRKIPAKSVGLTQTPQDLINRLSSINAYKVVLQVFLATPLPSNRENNRVYLALYFGPGAAKISFHLMGLSLNLYSSGPSPPDVEEPQSQTLPHPCLILWKVEGRPELGSQV